MNPLQRVTLVDQAETSLREAIREGHFGEFLPGVRPLAAALGINHLTAAEAVSRLVADGTLQANGPRRRFRIAGERAKNRERGGARKILFLTYEPLHETKPVALEILSQLMLERPEWEVRHRTAGRSDGRADRRYWDGLLKAEDARQLVVFAGRPPLAQWSLERGVCAYFLGGDNGRLPVPMLGVNAGMMIRKVMEKLIALGHTRICQPICGMPEGFCERQRRSMAECLEARGLPFVPNYHAPILPRPDPEELARVLAHVIHIRPPTALVLFDWEHFITASCVLRDHGLRIPHDISVAMLSQERTMHWHLPRIAHFEYPLVQVARTLTKWIETPPDDLSVHISLPLELVEAGSLATAPKRE